MKIKNYLLFFLVLMIVLVGCSQQSSGDANEIEALNKQVEELKNENEELKKEVELLRGEKEQEVDAFNSVNNENSDNATPLALLETAIIEDKCEITVKSTNFTNEVVPPNPTSYYLYYEVKNEGNIFLDVIIDYKNLEATDKFADEACSVKIKYDDKYEYLSFSTIEESGGSDFAYANITSISPLTIGTLHYIAEVPLEVQNSDKSVVALITAQGKEYSIKIK